MKNLKLFFTGVCSGKVLHKQCMPFLFMAGFVLASFPSHAQEPPCSLEGYTSLGTYNGHTYFISNFTEYGPGAVLAAAATGGHLATIADAGEDSFVASFAPYPYGAWIGFNDVADEGIFVWETGETDTYTNWCGGEPNNCCDIGEHWTVTNWFGCGWNDLYDGGIWGHWWYSLPLVVEFDGVEGDDDCDGIGNCGDVCPGGDDNGPCDATSLPPVSTLPPDWLCSNNNNSVKVKVCHNGNTLCVSQNAVAAHLAHGDFLGPCASCPQNYSAPIGNSDIHIAEDLSLGFAIYPNPSNGDFTISMDFNDPNTDTGIIQILNLSGQVVKRINIKEQHRFNIYLEESGVYLIQLITSKQIITQKLSVVN